MLAYKLRILLLTVTCLATLCLSCQASYAYSPTTACKNFHTSQIGSKDSTNLSREELTNLYLNEANSKKPNFRKLKKYIRLGADVNAVLSDGYPLLSKLNHYPFARQNTDDLALLLIENSAEINVTDQNGYTPLNYAIQYNQSKIGEVLIKKGANLNIPGPDGRSSLFLALSYKRFEMAKELINTGLEVNISDPYGTTPLILAANLNSPELVELLLSKGAKPNVLCPDNSIWSPSWSLHTDQATPLSIAAYYNSVEITQLLLAHGANINITDSLGNTPLIIAILKESYTVAAFLINRGAELNRRNVFGWSPLTEAIKNKAFDIVKHLMGKGVDINQHDKYGFTPLMFAANSDANITQWLIDKGADVKAQTSNGTTALHWARGNYEICKILLEHGADVNAGIDSGNTPLMSALGDHLPVAGIKLLINYGAKLNVSRVKNKTGNIQYGYFGIPVNNFTPLHWAVQEGDARLVKLMLEKGADVNAIAAFGTTPLLVATIIHVQTPAIIEMLLKNGARTDMFFTQLNDRSPEMDYEYNILCSCSLHNVPPLDFAIVHNSVETVRLLIKYGADANIKSKNSLTPLFFAVRLHTQNDKIIKLLLENGADPDSRDHNGYTPLSSCCNNYKIAKLLVEKGADVNAKSSDGTSLFDACPNKKYQRLLKKARAVSGLK